MNTEVEIKTRVADDAAFRRKIEAIGGTLLRRYVKSDEYYRNGGHPDPARDSLIRLRVDDAKNIVTIKRKIMKGNFERNIEREFTVSDPEAFRFLLSSVGYVLHVEKHKAGYAYDWNGVLVELSDVRGLGWFAEAEILIDANSSNEEQDSAIQSAEAKIASFLQAMGLGESDIETRSYVSMLRELAKKS